VPIGTVSAIGFALLYVLNPLDLVPDVLPVVGLLDDAAVVSACVVLVEQDLHAYNAWRERQNDAAAADSVPVDPQKETSG